MKVEVFSLCDFATVDAAGKMTIVGIFDTIYSRQIPITHGLCALAIRISFGRVEEGVKKFKLSFIDADGSSVMPAMEAQIPVQIGPQQSNPTAQVVSIMSQIKLPNFGEYSIDLAIDGRLEASVPLYVKPVPQQGEQRQIER
jgi:hypothetical protein